MYKYISHRGNLNGKIPERENSPEYIMEALGLGFECEIDVWYGNGDFYLGHDEPQHKIDVTFLYDNRLWCHAKNLAALDFMLLHKTIHCFWHEEDKFTLTSKGYVWTYPGQSLTANSICVLPEWKDYPVWQDYTHAGVCSDNIVNYRND